MNTIIEKQREILVYKTYDVVVVGGGIAGVAAAVASARHGVKTCLIEKDYSLGGLATIGLVVIYLPLCDGDGHQVSFGLAEEMLKLSVRNGGGTIPECWGREDGPVEERCEKRYQVQFNPASCILDLERFLIDNNVDFIYDTRLCDTLGSEGHIEHLIVENKSGRLAIRAGAVVDCTGDADVCFMAGETTKNESANVAAGWFYSYCASRGIGLQKMSRPFDPNGETVFEGVNGYSGVDAENVTQQIIESRKMIMERVEAKRKELNDESFIPFLIPGFPGFRMTRRLIGEIEFEGEDRLMYPDSIGLIGNWYRKGPVYSIPFRSIKGPKTDNLFVAGRCISAVRNGWDQSRVIPACAVTGEAAGTAAAMTAKQGVLTTETLQEKLREVNCKLAL